MVKLLVKRKLLKHRKIERLLLGKKALQKIKPIEQTPSVQTTIKEISKSNIITHITPIKYIKPFYQGSRIQIVKDIVYSCYKFQVLFQEEKLKHESEDIANFSVDNHGEYIATFTTNYMVRYCKLPNAEILFTHKCDPLYPIDMQFSPEDVFLALGGSNTHVRILNVKKNQIASEFRVPGSVHKLLWIPIMKKLQLAVACDDRKVTLYDLAQNRIICTFKGYPSKVTCLTFDQHILYTSCNNFVKIWDTSVQKVMNTIETEHQIYAMCLYQNQVVMGSDQGIIIIKQGGNIIQDQQLEGQEILKFMVDNNKLYAVTSELHLYTLSLIQGKISIEQCQLGYNHEILDVKFIPNNQLLLATNSPFMKLINLDNMEVILWKAHFSIIFCCAFSNNYIITGSKDNSVCIFKYEGFKIPTEVFKYTGHQDDVMSLDACEQFIVSVSNDKTIKIWDYKFASDQSIRTAIGHEKDINCVRLSPNKKLIATSSQDRSIKIWNETLMCTMVLTGHKRGVWDVQFSPIEKLIASASGDMTIRVWNLVDGTNIKTLTGTTQMLKLQWIGQSEILSGDAVGNIKIWNLKKQICVNTFTEHDGKIYALEIKKNQKIQIASGANDSLLVIWQDSTEQQTQENQVKLHQNQLKLQEIDNLIRDQQYLQAAILAFQNNFTKNFIDVVQEIIKGDDYLNVIAELVKAIILIDQVRLLNMLIQFNMSKKTTQISQLLLYQALRCNFIKRENKQELISQLKQLKIMIEQIFTINKLSQQSI
ncbi:hypothetical protein pb186bvf_013523 [Paramecium bursaria]